MSASASAGYGEPRGSDMIDLHVVCLNGEGWTFKLSHSTLARQVHGMVSKHLPVKRGARLTLPHIDSPLILQQTLIEQGIVGKAATLSCTYVPKTLNAAWCYLQGIPVCDEEHTLEGVAKIQLATAAILPNLNNPPTSLTNLTFGDMFNQSLQGVILPSSLQSLTFGETFNQSLQGVTLPSSL